MSYLKSKPGSIEEVAAKMSKYATESEYQQMFKKELEKTGKGIGAMTDKEKKDFFNKIDSKYKGKNEAVSQKQIDKFHTKLDKLVHKSFGHSSDEKKEKMKEEQAKNPYAIGMAAAMKAKDDKPPLKKSTITKAHDIAKSIEKDMKEEKVECSKCEGKGCEHCDNKGYHIKETHSFVTNKMNKAKKDAPGEKKVVDPEPKLKEPKSKVNFKEMYGKISASKKKMKEDEHNQNKKTTDTGEKPTEIDLKPQIKYSR